MFVPQAEAVAKAVANGGRLAMLLDLGDGKTAAALTTLLDLGAWPALVVAPATVVAANEWGLEAARWEHLRNLTVVPLSGSRAARERQLRRDPPHVEVVSYECFLWLTNTVRLRKRYNAVALDELSKMKAPGARRSRRARFQVPELDVRLGLTGHPTPNHLLDLWSEIFLIAGPEPLGPTFSGFRDRWFTPTRYVQTSAGLQPVDWEPWPGAVADIQKRVAPWVYVRPASAPVNKPPVRVVDRDVPMPPRVAALSAKLLKELWCEFPNGAKLEVLAASQIGQKLRQIAGGAVYTEGTKWEEVHDAKLIALDNALDELQGQPALVAYWYKHERDRIERRLNRAGRRYRNFDPQWIPAWNAGEYEVMLVHPQSTGYGLNLQAGGHHVLWFSTPWGYDPWMQLNGRLARPGQTAPWVTATRFLCGPADAYVKSVLDAKGVFEREFMEGL
jgi:hypothetical protein